MKRWLIVLAASLTLVVGAAVLIGWHLRLPALTQAGADLAPMDYDSALGLVACGLGLLLAVQGRQRVAIVCGLAAALIGLLALIGYAVGADLGIGGPERTAPNAALGLLLAGAALVLAGSASGHRHPSLVGILGSIVAALGTVALFGHLVQIEAAYVWGVLAPMSVHGAAGFLVFGNGLLAFSWRAEPHLLSRTPLWLPISIGLFLATAAFCLWLALRAEDREQLRHEAEARARLVRLSIADGVRSRVLSLERMALRWQRRGGTPRAEWEADAARYYTDQPGYQAIAWADAEARARWIVPLRGNEAAQDLDLAAEPHRGAALRAARETRRVTISAEVELVVGGRGFLAFVPIHLDDGSFDGFVVGVFRSRPTIGAILRDAVADYLVEIFEHDAPIYEEILEGVEGFGWVEAPPLELYGVTWRIRVRPTPATVAARSSAVPQATLVAGLVVALLLALTVRFGQIAARRREELAVLNRTLAQRVAEQTEDLRRHAAELGRRTDELAAANRALERSNRDLEHFAYVASHDLQEPLRAVRSFLELIESRYAERLDDTGREFIRHAVDGASRMKTLINDLLSYSRVRTRGHPPEPVDMRLVLQQVTGNLRPAIDESGARVSCDELPTIPADPTQMAQLLQNLIGNAIKYRGEEPPFIHVGAEERDGEWLFSVCDNGIGIDPRFFERIFVIFQRLHPPQKYGGTGIGLALCKQIVERHGGRIWVESQPGEGSTFYFTIPERSV